MVSRGTYCTEGAIILSERVQLCRRHNNPVRAGSIAPKAQLSYQSGFNCAVGTIILSERVQLCRRHNNPVRAGSIAPKAQLSYQSGFNCAVGTIILSERVPHCAEGAIYPDTSHIAPQVLNRGPSDNSLNL
jgi:hypothetical protein